MVEQSKRMLFDLKLMEDENEKRLLEAKRAEMQGKDKILVDDVEDFVGSNQDGAQVLDLDKELDAIDEESKEDGSVKLGSDMLAVSDLAFKEFRDRKQTIMSNMESLAAVKYPDNQTARD